MLAPSSILHPRLSAAPAARRGGVPGWVPLVILIVFNLAAAPCVSLMLDADT